MSYTKDTVDAADVTASSMLRIGTFIAYQALTAPAGELSKNMLTGAALGTCYVLSRSSTVLVGKRIVSWLTTGLDFKKKEELDKICKIKIISYGSLWIPAAAISCSLANFSGIPISFKNTALMAGAGAFFAMAIRIASVVINEKFKLHLPSMPKLIFTTLDPIPFPKQNK